MKCRISKQNIAVAIVGLVCLAAAGPASAQAQRDAIEASRANLKADRKVAIAEAMNLTDPESAAFWPLYREYRADVDKLTDRIVELVLEYADLYPNLPEERAKEMLSQYTKFEVNLASMKRKHLKKLGKVLPASKVFRFAQLDNRLDLGTRMALAAWIPIVPAGQAQPDAQPH